MIKDYIFSVCDRCVLHNVPVRSEWCVAFCMKDVVVVHSGLLYLHNCAIRQYIYWVEHETLKQNVNKN